MTREPALPGAVRVVQHQVLDADTRAAVLAMADAAAATDGVAPLGEQTLLALGAAEVHLVAVRDGAAIGYAQAQHGPHAELVVAPQHRRAGVGRALAEALVASCPGVRVWAHGSLPGAAALAARLGFEPSRRLLNLVLQLPDRLPPVELPEGVRLRTFLPGIDEPEWLALNARAFVALPDQGGWTEADLAAREAQPWFDPAGFLLAVRDGGAEDGGAMVGFHWTKVHERPTAGGGHEHVGEVYVVGVDPARRSHGLGRALTLAGLEHLRRQGVALVDLYVDAANGPAVALYTGLGFTLHHADTEYDHRPG